MHRLPSGRQQQVKLDFRSGGWVILLGALVALAFLSWRLLLVAQHTHDPYSAPMYDVADYGFDLSTCLVPRDRIVAAAPPDALPPLDDPIVVLASQIPAINKEHRKYLVPTDRVVGVAIRGEARAYPLRVLNWHEVCNDILGGTPIAVTYSPLCDSAVVFDRRVNGQEHRFATSGLLYNSNLLMFNRRSERQSASLWSQLQFRAVTGPAAAQGAMLRAISAQVVYWQDWERQHPSTTVVGPSREHIKKYRREPYASYFGSEKLRYPVAPLPANSRWLYKTDVVVVEVDGKSCVYPLPEIAQQADEQGHWRTTWQDGELRFDYRHRPPSAPTVWVYMPDGTPASRAQSFWFAWHSMHPQDVVFAGQEH